MIIGIKAKPSVNQKNKLTLEHQATIKELVLGRAKLLPKEQQANVIIKQWSALKNHFGKSYKEIDDEQFIEAVSLLSRLPLEGELIIDETQSRHCSLTADELDNILWVWFEAYQMNEFIGELVELLEKIKSQLVPKAYYSYYVEYKNHIRYTANIIHKLVQGVDLGENKYPLRQLEQVIETKNTARNYRLR